VRETVANDERMAREMERANAASVKDLPVYKDYGEGKPKWVELKLPEKLTEEQGRRVHKADITAKEKRDGWLDDGSWYEALDEQSKPIQNNYTKEPARGRTPEEAWLAGRLAEEGNAMGHCVGGYCQGVAAGESRIYSLRDAKGNPHVTVEVEPGGSLSSTRYGMRDIDPEAPSRISQIKGKQNRAPNPEYLPAVQDFVRNAPDGSPARWGEVRDLEGTGLVKHGGDFLTREEAIQRLNSFGAKIPGGWESKDISSLEIGLGAFPAPLRAPQGQRGSVSPELLKAAGFAGAGAALLAILDPTEKGTAALLGGGLGLLASRVSPGKVAAGADRFAGFVSTRVLNMSPALHRRWIDFEHKLLSRAADMRGAVDPFLVRANRKGLAANSELSRAILTNDEARVNAAIAAVKDPALDVAWKAVRSTLDNVGRELKASGRVTKLLTDYFPRIVKDRDGLLAALAKKGPEGIQAKLELEKRLAQAEARALKTRGTGLTELEQSRIVNDYLLAPLRRGSQPAWAKKRSIPEITAELEPFYLNITDGLHSYLRSAAMELEKARFFGKDAKMAQVGDQQHINVDVSIGNVVQRLLDKGEITHPQMVELSSMLKDRFGPGERASRGFVQDSRNVTNALLLGNPLSAVVQLGDVAIAASVHGMVPTLQAINQILTGRGNIRPRDIGLVNHISEEFVSTRGTAKFLHGSLKWGGFSLVDNFGKAVNLQAARLKHERLARTPKGQAAITAKYGPAWGVELPLLLKDLAAGQLTPRTRSFYFTELSRTQPISKFETSQAYLANADPGFGPMDARSLFQLKSFMLKQVDLLRREGYNEIRSGNKAKGFARLAKIGILLGISGAGPDMIKNFLMGKPFDAEWSDVPLNMLKTFGWSQYTLDKARSGAWQSVAGGLVIPPFRIYEDILKRDPKAIQYLPLVGKILYAQEYTEEGKARGQKKRRQEETRKITRELRPWFGEPDEAAKLDMKMRKQLLRQLRTP
jgi:hypothetical protein